jgi:hypothetical protein
MDSKRASLNNIEAHLEIFQWTAVSLRPTARDAGVAGESGAFRKPQLIARDYVQLGN